jgi:23S rRNA (cytosine1962-C5)-methyltransferase
VPKRRETAVRLRKPLERSVRAGHPWLYRDALEPFEAAPGEVARVLDRSGKLLGRGLCEDGPIAVRVFTTRDEPLDDRLLLARIEHALALRARVVPPDTDAYRLLHGEGDRLPGVVCDRYGERAVLRLDGAAARAHRERMAGLLRGPLEALGVRALLLRTGAKSGERVELAFGTQPPEEVTVREHGMKLRVNLWRGQKTGLFLDHRESRRRVRDITTSLHVLNLYGYTGGFSVAAVLGGAAHTVTVDSAAPALSLAARSFEANDLPAGCHEGHAADVMEYLAAAAQEREVFELVIADPPSFAPNERAKDRALEAYATLHQAALSVLAAGGYYLAASCSSHVDRQAFEASLREGARRARRVLQVLERWGAPADHPRLLAFPEGDYLKVTLLRAF